MYLKAIGFFGMLLLLPLSIIAHSLQDNKEYTTTRIDTPPEIDGWLNEEFWDNLPGISDFIQDYPEEGATPTESTTVKIAYDDEALYVGFYNYDSEPDKIIHRLARRDYTNSSDFVKIEIDSYHDHRTAYMFEVTAGGIQVDAYRYNDGWRDESWDTVWESDVRLTDFGWTAEMKIPYSCLRFNNHKAEQFWGLNLVRYIPRKDEVEVWSFVPRDKQGWTSRYGHLAGIEGVEPRTHLEVMPYLVSSGEREPESLGNPDGKEFTSDIGVDLKYGLTPNLTLDATINPDFGQVEADAAVLNLSTYETWYPEKRPFFIEGNKYFETRFNLFYSRRIGQRPRNYPDGYDYFIDKPEQTTILGAAKITGRTDNGWVIGFMNSVTDRERARYVDEDGIERTSTVEEPANYNITRVKKEFSNGNNIGIMTTMAHQLHQSSVYTGGLDWEFYFGDRAYAWRNHLVGSRDGVDGWGYNTSFEKEAGEHFRGAVGGEIESRDFDLNRLGYLGRANYAGAWYWLQYRDVEDPWIFREWYHNLNFWHGYNLDGDLINIGGNYNFNVTLHNNWATGAGFEIEPSHYEDRETRGGPLYWNPSSKAMWQWWESNSSGKVNLGYNWTYGEDRDGRIGRVGLWSSVKLSDRIELEFAPSYNRSWDQNRWITDETNDADERVDIFGELDTETFNFELRGTFMFNRDMSLQLYSQLFFASGEYSEIKELDTPKTFKPLSIEYTDNPDFISKALNLNMVFRWEYMPGSTFYLVYTQARDDYSDIHNNLKLNRDFSDLMDLSANSVLLAKVSYWWHP
ncbi:MAG: hypothetical protein GF315_03175 [candidate division Zixibacteria bacterium]|nr:hypothetical protein [candidate division Zixibacteria bacterium]